MKEKEMKQGLKMRLRIIIGLGVLSLAFGSCLPKEEGVTKKPKPATISSGNKKTSSTISTRVTRSGKAVNSTISTRGGKNETGNSTTVTRSGKAVNSTISIKTESTTTIEVQGVAGKSNSPKVKKTNINQFAGGTGSRWDPYQIATVGHLDLVRWNLKKHFIVIKDLDLGAIANFEPIGGYEGDKFGGIFDGNGKVIRNLTINRPREEDIGLFGAIDSKATVKNVKLEDVNLKGKKSVGGLVGENNGGTIDNSYSTGQVKGEEKVGGLVGENSSYNKGKIQNSHSTATVTGTGNYVGGLVGHGSASNSYATGNVFGENYVGGLVGQGSASNSYATGTVTGNDDVGGLVGQGSASNSYATGKVEGNDKVGGLVGYNWGTVQNSYATGNVEGNDQVGGLVGRNYDGTITNSYATGTVTGKTNVGGLVGYIYSSYYSSGGKISGKNYWKSGSAGRGEGYSGGYSGSGKVVEATDEDFRALNARSTGWSTAIWEFEEGKYPRLKWQD